jgi:hypothetical protein
MEDVEAEEGDFAEAAALEAGLGGAALRRVGAFGAGALAAALFDFPKSKIPLPSRSAAGSLLRNMPKRAVSELSDPGLRGIAFS